MTIPLPTSSSLLNVSDISTIMKHIEDKSAVVLGPGLGNDARTAELVLYLYHSLRLPVIIDADALNILARHKKQLKSAGGPRIFTPHPGELSRLIDQPTDIIFEIRLNATKLCHETYKCEGNELIVILKGAGTLVVSDDGQVMINTSGNPGMATGGMGDVLSGIIGSLVCQGLSNEVAAGAGVYLHGMAGDRLFEENGQGFTASELANNIPLALKKLQDGE